MESFYGYDDEQRSDMDAFYDAKAARDEAADFYGDAAGSQQSEMSDLYGHDIEQDRD